MEHVFDIVPVCAGEMKPTLFIGVPRVFDRIYAGVYAKVNGGGAIKRFLFNYGYRWKLSYLLKGFAHHQASSGHDTGTVMYAALQM